MKKFHGGSGAAGCTAVFAAVLCLAGTTAQSQLVGYSTSFYNGTTGSPDIVNGSTPANFTTYTSPNTPTDNLAGQNGWATTDPVGATGGTQVNGGTDFVGNFGTFFGDTAGNTNFAGAIGGEQRNAAPTTAAPDVVPSNGSGGVVSLYHALPTGATSFNLDVDFVLTSPGSFTSRDEFAFSLRNTAGTALFSIYFVPTTNQTLPDGTVHPADNVVIVAGNGAAPTNPSPAGSTAVILSSNYHLHLAITGGRNGTLAGSITDPVSGNSAGTFSGSLDTTSIGRFSADWNLLNKTTSPSGGLTGAGDNALGFDNLVVTVPEPSTYASLALGLLGLAGTRRWHRRQA